MVIINLAHPLTGEQLAQIERLAGEPIERVVEVAVHFDNDRSFEEQAEQLMSSIPIEGVVWQTMPLVVNLPGHSAIAAVLLAQIHGRMGHFPTIVRLRPADAPLTRFEAAELVNLQAVRDGSRSHRSKG